MNFESKKKYLDVLVCGVERGVLKSLNDGLLSAVLVEECLDLGSTGVDSGISGVVNHSVLNVPVLIEGIHINSPVLGLLAHIDSLRHVGHDD